MKYQTDDLRIMEMKEVTPPTEVHAACPITEQAAKTVYEARREIHDILHGKDDRLLVVIGPLARHSRQPRSEHARMGLAEFPN